MDLLDIFDDGAPKAAKAEDVAASPKVAKRDNPPPPGVSREVAGELPDHLVTGAQAAASAHDDAAAADAIFRVAEERLRKQLALDLAELKARRLEALETLSESLDGLLSNMDKANVSRIPMTDRPDIVVKTTAGKRKSITKKWLVETYGNEEAKKIWDAVPTGEPKREVIIPDRYDDEPEPY
jgi:hypothetical protein